MMPGSENFGNPSLRLKIFYPVNWNFLPILYSNPLLRSWVIGSCCFFHKIWNFNLFVLLSIGHEVAPPCFKSRENELLVSWSVIGQLPKILSSHWLKLHRQLVHSCLKSEWIVFTKIASNWYSLKIVEWKYLHEIFS